MTNTATAVDFISFAGAEIKINTLTLGQQDELAQYLRHIYLEETKRQIVGLPLELSKYAWDRAKEKADRIYPGREEHAEAVYTVKGAVYALFLAMRTSDTTATVDRAAEILYSSPTEITEKVKNAVGYRPSEVANKPGAVPIAEIIHWLSQAPFNYSPKEIREMTLDDIAIIFTKPEGSESKDATWSDIGAIMQRANEIREKNKLGIWGESIWQ